MIHFLLWKWAHPTYRSKFDARAVNVVRAQLARNVTRPHRILTITDDARGIEGDTYPIWDDHSTLRNPSGSHLPSCFRRLRMFDCKTQVAMGIKEGEFVCSVDLDVLVLKNIDHLFALDGDFMAWQVMGQMRNKVYNGSLVGFIAGTNQEIWDEFDPIRSPAAASNNGYFGSDQGWLSYKKMGKSNTNTWTIERDGIFAYHREIVQRRYPWTSASMIFFNGRTKPWDEKLQASHPWVKKFWRL